MSQFSPETYQADGGFYPNGLPIIAVGVCVAGVGLGWLASFIGQWFYLIVLFPAAIGFGLGLVGAFLVQFTKMRSTGMAILLSLIASVMAMTSLHYFNYQRFLDGRQDILARFPDIDNVQVRGMDAKTAEMFLAWKQMRDIDSFPAYVNHEAEQGVTVSRHGRGGFNLGYVGTWIYWGLELAGVAAIVCFMMAGTAATPFCIDCNEWKNERPLGLLLRKDENVVAALNEGNVEVLREYVPTEGGGNLILSVAVCPKCDIQSPIAVKLEEVKKVKKDKEEKKTLTHVVYPGEALAAFEALFVPKIEAVPEE